MKCLVNKLPQIQVGEPSRLQDVLGLITGIYHVLCAKLALSSTPTEEYLGRIQESHCQLIHRPHISEV